MTQYTATYHTAAIAVDDYIARFRDAERFEACCRACPNYNRSWGCPPFNFDVLQRLQLYKSLLIVATRITPTHKGVTLEEFYEMICPERMRLESRLLDLESQYNGLAASFIGSCLYCPDGNCTRLVGMPCRHPDKVRPSLEAYGFDIGRTTSELFNIELVWSNDNAVPQYIVLVCALFHNADSVDFNIVE